LSIAEQRARKNAQRNLRYATDPEFRAKIIAARTAYCAANPEKIKESARLSARLRYAANPEPAREKARAKRLANPEAHRESVKRSYRKNIEKRRAYKRAWHVAHPGYSLQASRKSLYPSPTRPVPAACECCGKPERGGKALALDHDHATNEFRGWLCALCNTAIGKLGDSREGVLRALAYLDRGK
jgi:hypothetical protein